LQQLSCLKTHSCMITSLQYENPKLAAWNKCILYLI
jgi:hypothetical protein